MLFYSWSNGWYVVFTVSFFAQPKLPTSNTAWVTHQEMQARFPFTSRVQTGVTARTVSCCEQNHLLELRALRNPYHTDQNLRQARQTTRNGEQWDRTLDMSALSTLTKECLKATAAYRGFQHCAGVQNRVASRCWFSAGAKKTFTENHVRRHCWCLRNAKFVRRHEHEFTSSLIFAAFSALFSLLA